MSNRLFECASMGSATGGEARAAHCPRPTARLLLGCKKNARPRGTGEVGRRSRIFRRLMAARPPTRLAPAPAFCSRSPQLLAHPRPAQCPLSCSAFPRGPGAQKDGAPCVQRQGLVAGHGHASGGAPQRGIGRPRPCVSCRATSDAVELARRGGGGGETGLFRAYKFLAAAFRVSGPVQKVSADPYFNPTTFPTTFPHFSPLSALGTRGGGGGVWRVLRPRGSTRLGFTFGGSSAALVGRIGALRTLCKKCRQTPIFTLLVF